MVLDDPDEARQIGEVAVDDLHVVQDAEPAQPLADDVRAGGAAHHADDAIALLQQQLGEVGAILAGDAGDEGSGHGSPFEEATRWNRSWRSSEAV